MRSRARVVGYQWQSDAVFVPADEWAQRVAGRAD